MEKNSVPSGVRSVGEVCRVSTTPGRIVRAIQVASYGTAKVHSLDG